MKFNINEIKTIYPEIFQLTWVLNNIWLSQRPPRRAKITQFANTIENVRKTEQDEKKSETKINKLKDKEVQELIFSKYLRDTNNIKNGNQNISSFFKSK